MSNNGFAKTINEKIWEEKIGRLRHCPCCGGKSEIKERFVADGLYGSGYKVVYIVCSRCGLRSKELVIDGTFDEWHTPEEAAELWNRRYSGINDRNGKPIYHGDHIRVVGKNWFNSIQGEYEVRYSDITFEWCLRKVAYEPFDYSFAKCISFSDLNIGQFTDEIELVSKED